VGISHLLVLLLFSDAVPPCWNRTIVSVRLNSVDSVNMKSG
jgi:hypothetical protein